MQQEKNQEWKEMVKISRVLIICLVVILVFSGLGGITYGGVTEGSISHDPADIYTARENMAVQILAHDGPYYVATTGNNSNPGTIDQPWRTIQHAVDIVEPGDTIYVRDGTYNEWIGISNSGLPGQPITLRSYPNETVILNGSGLEWRYGIDIGGADYWTLQDLIIRDYIREGLRGFGFVSWSGSKGITLRNLEFSLVGTPIKFHEGGEDILIEDIYAHDYDDGGFDCGPAGACSNLTIRNFTAQGPGTGDDTGVDGFAVEEGSNILVENCISEAHPGDGFDFKSDNTTLRRVIARNNARNSIKLWGQNSMLENCLSYDCGLTNLVLAEGGSYTVINCLFANRDTYGYLAVVGYDQPLDTPLQLHNTIFYNDNPAMGGTTLYLGDGVNLTADYNIYYNPYREEEVICAGFLEGQCFGKDDINNGTWFTASGSGEYSIYADPLFVNATAHDYHLTAESPAIDAGTAEGAPSDDLDGYHRPQGAGYDIGPYEYREEEPSITWIDDDFNESTPGWHYDHFKTVQEGIAAVAENGRVVVYNGTYYDNVVVGKTIDLMGKNRATTIIDGGGSGDVVYVAANRVNISGFCIRNGSEEGVYLTNSDNCSIFDTTIYSNGDVGILLNQSENNTIMNCSVHNNTCDGILLEYSNYTRITGITTCWNGICMNGEGILLMHSNHCYIADSIAYENGEDGIILEPACCFNNISNNKAYGNADSGILISTSSNENTIYNNTVYNNTYDGILIETSSGNAIIGNTAHNNREEGIYVTSATDTDINVNTIVCNAGYGIYLNSSTANSIYNNYFNNTNNSYDNGDNIWNITKTEGKNIIGGLYLGGNYWSDYAGNDSNHDGLGDTPYSIPPDINNNDYLPLVPVGLAPPEITAYAPKSPVNDYEGATRTFNISINQPVDVNWQINGTVVLTNKNVTEASYTNTSAVNGTWNVSVFVYNTNGTDMQTWLWSVTSPCFIATAAYGTSLHEDIDVLRDFRDEYLMSNPAGRIVVKIYYALSPPFAFLISKNDGLRTIIRAGLIEPLVYTTKMVVG